MGAITLESVHMGRRIHGRMPAVIIVVVVLYENYGRHPAVNYDTTIVHTAMTPQWINNAM